MNTNDLELLRHSATLLEAWAAEAIWGGWSLQHVKPMRDHAVKIWAEIGRNVNSTKILVQTAHQLDAWADECYTGSWSTVHVKPMRALSDKIYAHIGRCVA